MVSQKMYFVWRNILLDTAPLKKKNKKRNMIFLKDFFPSWSKFYEIRGVHLFFFSFRLNFFLTLDFLIFAHFYASILVTSFFSWYFLGYHGCCCIWRDFIFPSLSSLISSSEANQFKLIPTVNLIGTCILFTPESS